MSNLQFRKHHNMVDLAIHYLFLLLSKWLMAVLLLFVELPILHTEKQ